MLIENSSELSHMYESSVCTNVFEVARENFECEEGSRLIYLGLFLEQEEIIVFDTY